MIKKTLLWFWILLKVSMVAYLPSAAAEELISYGLGIFHSAENWPTETKVFRLAHRQEIDTMTYYMIEWGLWVDTAGNGRLSSTYVAGSIGVRVDLKPFFIANSLGLGAVAIPDAYLGGAFPQFTEELTIGVQGSNRTTIGLSYKHFSSAGIVSPNMGRDFVLLTIGVGTW